MPNIDRLESTILRALTKILREDVKDPNVGFITLTDVRLTKDLSYLTIYYTVLDKDKKDLTEQALKRSNPFIRSQLARAVNMRKMPKLLFKYDESLERGNRIESGLKKVLNNDDK